MKIRLKKKIISTQPDWVCTPCGIKYGLWWNENKDYIGPEIHCATYNMGKCDVCGKAVPCTEARDFGYLREEWARN